MDLLIISVLSNNNLHNQLFVILEKFFFLSPWKLELLPFRLIAIARHWYFIVRGRSIFNTQLINKELKSLWKEVNSERDDRWKMCLTGGVNWKRKDAAYRADDVLFQRQCIFVLSASHSRTPWPSNLHTRPAVASFYLISHNICY